MVLLAFGLAGSMILHVILVIVALLAGFLVAAFSDVEWYLAALIAYLGIRLIVASLDLFTDLSAIKCPQCRKAITTSRPVRCTECGGAALRK